MLYLSNNIILYQKIAKRGNYGSYLLEDQELVLKIISRLAHSDLKVPVTCKVRKFTDNEKTFKYYKRMEQAGCSLLTVHGRTRHQNKEKVGKCDWEFIRRVKQELKIPVFANGGIYKHADIVNCLEFTKADGVMSSEALLENPMLFQDTDN